MVTIRELGPGDAAQAARIFFFAVQEGTRDLYSAAQRRAWAGDAPDPQRWEARLAGMQGFVAEAAAAPGGGAAPVGFITVDATGFVDLAFVLPGFARRGIGARLLAAAEARARALGAAEMRASASLASEPFFARHGWQVVAREEIARGDVRLKRAQMRKALRSEGQGDRPGPGDAPPPP